MATFQSWFTYLICMLQLVAAQTTVTNTYADGSYCLHCSGATALDALGCDLAFIFSGCFFGALFGDLGTCGVPDYSAASSKSCYSLGSCATSCTGTDASGYYLDYCCFMPGSPFITPYLDGTTTPTPTTVEVASATPSNQGISCDIVDALANQYAATSNSAPDTNGYYGQVLNLACLRSTCPNPACQRVNAVRSTDPDCANFGGSFDFEQNVFGKFTNNLDPNKVAQDAVQFQNIGQIASVLSDSALVYQALRMPPPQMILLLALTQSGFTDSKTLSTVAAGTSHFLNDLGPNFASYINNLVASSLDDTTLAAKISALKAEHDRLFKCAVIPGFDAQASNGELPVLPALAADIAVPIVAQLVRDVDLYNALRDIKGESIPQAIAGALGIQLPSFPSLQWDPRNWIDTSGLFKRDLEGRGISSSVYSQKGMTTSLTEISSASGANVIILLDLASHFEVDVDNSKPNGDGFMARSMLFYLSAEQPPRSPTLFKIGTNDVSIIGPIGSIYPASYQMVFYNTSHIIPSNISDPLIPVSSLPTTLGTTSKEPISPLDDGTPLMYSTAVVSLSYNPVYVSGMSSPVVPVTDVTIFDIVTGLPLKGVSYVPDANGGVFSVAIQPGNGIWGGHWGSGGSFALGLKTNTVSSSSPSAGASSTKTSASLSGTSLSAAQTPSSSSSQLSVSTKISVSSSANSSSSMQTPSLSSSQTIPPSSISQSTSQESSSSQFSSSSAPQLPLSSSPQTFGSVGSSSLSIHSNTGVSASTASSIKDSSPASTSSSGPASTRPATKTSTINLLTTSSNISFSSISTTALLSTVQDNEIVTTVIIYTTTSICPIVQTLTSGSSTIATTTYSVSTITATLTSTIPITPTAPPNPAQINEVTTTIIIYTTTSICPIVRTITSGSLTITKSTYSFSTITVTTTSTTSCTFGCKAGAGFQTSGIPTAIIPGPGSGKFKSVTAVAVLPTAPGNYPSGPAIPTTLPSSKASSLPGVTGQPISSNTQNSNPQLVSTSTVDVIPQPYSNSPLSAPGNSQSQNEVQLPSVQASSKTVIGGAVGGQLSSGRLALTTSAVQSSKGGINSGSVIASYSGPSITGSAVSLRMLNIYTGILCVSFVLTVVIS